MFKSLSKTLISVALLASGLVGCAHVNSVSLTPIPANRSHKVSAETSRWIVLGFNFDNDYIDSLVEDLKRACPNGVVSGILTKDETIAYLLVFKKHVVTTGYCNTAVAATKTATAGKK
ncbi:hypothetical protein ACES2L_07920 [Bdellovibrio bacteriovorus]